MGKAPLELERYRVVNPFKISGSFINDPPFAESRTQHGAAKVPRRVASSGVATTMSLQTGRSPRARRISVVVSRWWTTSGIITSRSTSLHLVAVPRAWDPKRTIRAGRKPSTMLYHGRYERFRGRHVHVAPPMFPSLNNPPCSAGDSWRARRAISGQLWTRAL